MTLQNSAINETDTYGNSKKVHWRSVIRMHSSQREIVRIRGVLSIVRKSKYCVIALTRSCLQNCNLCLYLKVYCFRFNHQLVYFKSWLSEVLNSIQMEGKIFPKRMSNDDSNGPKRPKKRKIGTLNTCDDCGFSTSNKKSLIQHVNNVHLNIHCHLQQI